MEPEHPKAEPAGGAWPDTADVDPPPAKGPAPHRPAPPEALDPGTSDAHEPEEGEE